MFWECCLRFASLNNTLRLICLNVLFADLGVGRAKLFVRLERVESRLKCVRSQCVCQIIQDWALVCFLCIYNVLLTGGRKILDKNAQRVQTQRVMSTIVTWPLNFGKFDMVSEMASPPLHVIELVGKS